MLLAPTFIVSEDEESYEISPFQATEDRLQKLWDAVNEYESLTSTYTRGNFEAFASYVLSAQVVFLTVTRISDGNSEDVGVVYADNIIPGFSASGHFLFWDLQLAGRQRLLLTAMRDFMDLMGLHRLDFEVPINAYSALKRLHRMGLRLEGRKRDVLHIGDEWMDTLLFGTLREELTDEALEAASIEHGDDHDEWYGLLRQGTELNRFIMRGA